MIQSGLVERRLIFRDMAKGKWADYTWPVAALWEGTEDVNDKNDYVTGLP